MKIARFLPDIIILAALLGAAWLCGWLGFLAPRAAELPMATPGAVLPVRSFNDLEPLPDGVQFRWTSGQSRLGVPNSGGPVRLRLHMLDGPLGATPLTLDVNGRRLDMRLLPGLRRYDLLLPPAQAERLELMFATPTTTLARREIGIGIAGVRTAGGGMVPLAVLLALTLATLGCYTLLRHAHYRGPLAAGIVVALLLAVALWLHAGGWQYALAGRALVPLGMAALVAAGLDLAQKRRRAEEQKRRTLLLSFSPLLLFSFSLPLALLVVLALALRLPWLVAPDSTGDLELAARRMFYLATEGLAGAYLNGGDYMPLRLYYLWAAGQVVGLAGASFTDPIAPLTKLVIKLPQLLADLATAVVIYGYARWILVKASSRGGATPPVDQPFREAWTAALVAAMYTAAPPVWINSAWWGQVDAWLMLPMLGAVLLLGRGAGRGWALWAVALLIKTQAIIIVPVLFIATVRRHGARGVVRGAAVTGAVLFAGIAPLVFAGQGFGLVEAYLGAVGRFPRTTYGAYNLWYLALGGNTVNDFDAVLGPFSYRQLGFGLLGAATLLVCAALWRRSDTPGRAGAGAALALAFFVLPTQMHARYLFLPLAFVALAVCSERRLAPLFVLLVASATINVFGILDGFWPAATALINATPLPFVCAVVNIAALLVLLGRLLGASFATAGRAYHEDTKTRRCESR
jgi:hypothetical protein